MKLLLAVCAAALCFAGAYCDETPKPEEKKDAKDLPELDHLKLSFDPNDEYELELVQVIFRHGDRIPDKAEIYPKDPFEKTYASHGFGQLTKAGKQREFKIGQILRKRYGKFLGDFTSREVFAFSTNVDRTKMSLQLVLAGLYPPTERTSWSNAINWSPIPTNSDPLGTDFLMGFACQKFDEYYHEVGLSAEIQDKLKKHKEFYTYLHNQTGITTFTPTTIFTIYNNIRSAKSLGLGLPSWCTEEDYKKIVEIAPIAMRTLTHTDAMRKILAGLVIQELLDNIEKNDEYSRKLYLFGGHDLNVASFTNVHNFSGVPPIPDFGTTLVIEQLKSKNVQDLNQYIRMFLWTGASEKWIPLKMDKCELTCPMYKYKKLTKHLLPDESAKQCTRVNALCRSPELIRYVDVSYELMSLYTGSDLRSFKYLTNFTTPYSPPLGFDDISPFSKL